MLKFTQDQLHEIYRQHQLGGPRGAFAHWAGVESHQIQTCDVEDFIVQFYHQYNLRVAHTF